MHASRAVCGIAIVTLMLAVMWGLEVIDYVSADDTSDVTAWSAGASGRIT